MIEKIIEFILNLITGHKPKEAPKLKPIPEPAPEPTPEPTPEPKAYITLQDWITASQRFPERAESPELTDQVLRDAKYLVDQVNALLRALEVDQEIKISSGFRPTAVNNQTTGAAARSGHTRGKALDIMDDQDQSLGKLIASRPDLLRKYDLMLESLKHTKGKWTNWVHLDTVKRPDRPSRTFIP